MTTEPNRVTAALMIAVRRMRDACDSAERAAVAGDSAAIQDVLNTFAWAFSNASSNIQAAMSRLESQHGNEVYALKRRLAEATGETQAS